MTRSRYRSAIRGATYVMAVAVTCAAAQTPAAASDPVVTAQIDERADARLYSLQLRIQPTWLAEPGACLLLSADDLRVRLRGRRVDDDRIELVHERRRTLHALVIDTSRSMAGGLDHVRRAAAEYVSRLDPLYDRAMIVTFDDSVLLSQPPTNDREQLLRVIDRLRTGTATSLNDGLHYVVRELSVHRERPVMILLSDGLDTASVHQREDVMAVLDRRTDLTVFSIGFDLPPMIASGPSGLISIRRFLQKLASRTNGKFFDAPTGSTLNGVYRRIHEMLQTEAVLRVSDPDPTAAAGELRVGTTRAGCKIKIYRTRDQPTDPLAQPLGRPYPELPSTFELPPDPRYLKTAINRAFHETDPTCRQTAEDGDSGKAEDLWRAESGADGIGGCTLDVAMDYGALYDPYAMGSPNPFWAWNGFLKTRTRRFVLGVPPLSQLPNGPDPLIERLGEAVARSAGEDVKRDSRKKPYAWHARPYHDLPMLVHGRTFFDLRERLATELFLFPDYRDWVLGQLQNEAREELERLEDRYRQRVPDASTAAVELAVQLSEEGQRIRRRADNPSPLDLSRFLSAWLGDIPAHRLLADWESRQISDLLRDPELSTSPFIERWRAARQLLFAPSYTRELTLLLLAHDTAAERVGFYRIVLPRPGWFLTRVRNYKSDPGRSDLPFDLVPEQPSAYRAMRALLSDHPDVARHLRQYGYRVTKLDYASRLKPRKQRPDLAFARLSASLELRADDGRVLLELDLDRTEAAGAPANLVGLRATTERDDRLETLVLQMQTQIESIVISRGNR